jgi:hypothetical protein
VAINLSVVVEGFQLEAGSLLIDRKGLKYSLTVAKYMSARNWHTCVCVCVCVRARACVCVWINIKRGMEMCQHIAYGWIINKAEQQLNDSYDMCDLHYKH